MKWIKHMTATTDDEKIARLIGDGGLEGLARYGVYWRVQEILASQMEGKDPSCSVSYPLSVWSRLLFTRGSLVFSTLSRLAVTHLVTVERDGDDVRVTNRNLLKYRDEYSKKSRHTPDDVRPRTEGEGDIDIEGDKESTKDISAELGDKAADPAPVPERIPAGSLPLNTGKNFVIFEDQIASWQETFPIVDVRQQLAEMREWCKANPKRRKTKSGVLRFVVTWLSKEQDAGPKSNHSGGNAYVNGHTKKPTIVEAQLAELQRFTDKRAGNGRQDSGSSVAVGDDDGENSPGGGHGRVDRESGLLLTGEADWGL